MTGRSEDGFTSVTFMMMMTVLILAVGGMSVDLWHLVSEHRRVAGVVDGAAVAAAGAVDVAAFRAAPDLPPVLDARVAIGRACTYLEDQGGVAVCPGVDAEIVVSDSTVTVTMRHRVELTLMKLFSALDPGSDRSAVEVAASSTVGIAAR